MIRWPTLFVALMMPTAVAAHSWYPWECCADNDCAPIHEIKILPNGDMDITIKVGKRDDKGRPIEGEVIEMHAVFPSDFKQRTSQDGETHACIVAGQPKCLFIGAGG